MNKFLLLILFTTICSTNANALINNDELKYSLISPDLLNKSNSVVRDYNIEIKVEKLGKVDVEVEKTITILNSKGDKNAFFLIDFDQFSKVKKVKGTIYDSDGKFVKKIFPDEFIESNFIDGGAFSTDVKTKRYMPNFGNYPYTVKYEYTMSLNGYMDYIYEAFTNFNQSLNHCQISISEPNNLISKPIFNTPPTKHNDTVIDKKHLVNLEWSHLKSINEEDYNYDARYVLPTIQIVPSQFTMGGNDGEMTSWQNFGNWIYKLYENRQNFNEQTIQFYKNLCKNSTSDKEKVKILYQYLQSNTRYVLLKLGMGGFQPIEAQLTHDSKYGDCKGLCNYMMAMLKANNINSNIAIVYGNSRSKDISIENVSNQFNHVILYVPLANDSIWLDCTSSDLSFNSLGEFTENRTALILDKEKSRLIKTPTSNPKNNCLISSKCSEINLNQTKSKFHIKSTGSEKELINFIFKNLQKENVNSSVLNSLGLNNERIISNFKLTEINYDTFKINITSDNKESTALKNNEYFLPICNVKPTIYYFNKNSTTHDIVFEFPYTILDTISYNIINPIEVESIPKENNINNQWFEFTSKHEIGSENKLLCFSYSFTQKKSIIK